MDWLGLTNSSMEVINPNTDLAWVTGERKLVLSRYAEVGSIAALIWDILLHMSEEYQMLTNYRITYLTVTYFLARLSTFAFTLGLVVVNVAPIGNCNLVRYVNFLFPLAAPLSILPFVPRVSALYCNKKPVIIFFTLSWLSVVATAIYRSINVQGRRIGPTKHCSTVLMENRASISATCLFIHDTLIFVATSWAFVLHSHAEDNVKDRLKVIIFGSKLSGYMKSLLRDGQAYYLLTIFGHIFLVSQFHVESPVILTCTVGVPTITATSMMAAYVYRNIRLGYYKDYSTTPLEFSL